MSARAGIDTSVTYKMADLPQTRTIEVPDPEGVAAADWPVATLTLPPYRPAPELVKAVDLAIALGRPLLLQGDPGCGKTALAYALAYALGYPLEEAYIKSTSRAQDLLYTYDAVRRLYDAQLGDAGPKEAESGEPLVRNVRNYIRLGPLGRAIVRAQLGRRSVVLIDEIDKADLDFPNDLLWELDQLRFRVEEAPEMIYAAGAVRPIVVITHNEEKPLPPAFLRRCVFHYVEFPQDRAEIEAILKLHDITDQPLRSKAVDVVLQLRQMDLSKRPGLSELIDWAGYAQALQTSPAELDSLPHVQALLKQQSDQQRALRGVASL